MPDITRAIHEALYAALTAPSPPTVAGNRVYDLGNVPAVGSRTFPYVVLGEYDASDAGDKGDANTDEGHAVEFAQTIHVWSQKNDGNTSARGKAEAEAVMAAIYNLLHEQPQALAGSPLPGTMVTLRCAYRNIFLDADGQTMHGVMRFEGFAHSA